MVDRAGVAAVLKPIKVGPEMAALRRFLPEVVTWEGTIHEGGMDRAPRRCAGSAGGHLQAHPGRALDRRKLRARPVPGGRHVRVDVAAALGGGLGTQHGE